jgi:L-alanine-DL-glutamate epimerase-like enolase superfamily enzyme
MKITDVATTLFSYDLPRYLGDANSPGGRKTGSGCLLELQTDSGMTGLGIAGTGVVPQVRALVEETLEGEDPRPVRGLWQRMASRHFKGGHDGLVNDAIAVLDMALWDLRAKSNDEPLWKTLGGARPRVPCYASGLDMPLTDAALHDYYHTMAVDHGIRAGKLKVGIDQDADLRRLGIVRDALATRTPNPQLMIDANEYWSPKQAIRKVLEFEQEFDLTWVEEPARRWDFLGLRRIKDAVKAAVCAGENLDTLGDFLPYFHHQSADIIQVSSGMGGITPALQIADAAFGFELPVALGAAPGMLHAHLAAVMPNAMTVEVFDPAPAEGVFSTDVRIDDGWLVAGDAPGLGLTIDREALTRQTVAAPPARSGPSPAGRRPGAGLYEVAITPAEASHDVGGLSV